MKCLRTASLLVTVVSTAWLLAGCSAETEGEAEAGEASQFVKGKDHGKQCGKHKDFEIWSPSFESGAPLPTASTCEGKTFAEGTSPELNFSKGPKGTRSYALVFRDLTLIENRNQLPTPPNKNLGYHWAIWNIPHNTRTLPAALPNEQFPLGNSAEQLSGGPGGPTAYFGPCPSWATYCSDGAVPRATDEYSFTLYALDEKLVTPPYDPSALDPVTGRVKSKIRQYDEFFAANALDVTELLATSDAVPTAFPQVPHAVCAKNPE
ncbi:MAG TPA: YbhB/YbcL family Raf kinase inhibitor-like protein [Polyangiaceae bacterium]|nr:YbhB/YbcL family Raf kinase inhibitor-like protein [Polyangiaceae bacterium]